MVVAYGLPQKSLHWRNVPPSHRQQATQSPVAWQLQQAGVPQGHVGQLVTVPLQLTEPRMPLAQFWFWNVQVPPVPVKVQLTLTLEVSLQVAVAEQVLKKLPCRRAAKTASG
jgi:hypothetical protein